MTTAHLKPKTTKNRCQFNHCKGGDGISRMQDFIDQLFEQSISVLS